MERERSIGTALERLWTELDSQKRRSGWDRKLKGAGYMRHRNDYEGTEVPEIVTHDCTAVECLDTYVDGFVGYIMPQDDDWFMLMPRVKFNSRSRDKEYGGFGDIIEDSDLMKVMTDLTDIALMEFSASGMYAPARMFTKDAEILGNGYLCADEDGEGGLVYKCLDPMECAVAEDDKQRLDVFMRHFMMSPVDVVRKWKDAKLEHCWERVHKGASAETADVEVYEAILPKDYLYDPETDEPLLVNGKDSRKLAHVVWIPLERELVCECGCNEMPVFTFSPSRDSDKTPYGKGLVTKYLDEIVLLDDDCNLKHIQFRKNVNPPMLVHQALRSNYSSKSGAVVYTADLSAQGATPLFKEGASNNYSAMVNDIEEAKNHIRQLMNADLFRTLMASTDSRKTAYEVSELKNEAVTLLSMKIGTYVRDFLEPLVKRTIKVKLRNNRYELPGGMSVEKMCKYVDTCTVALNSVFVRRLQGYLKYQGLVSGLQFLGAVAQLEQSRSIGVLNTDVLLRAGLFGAGFPAYAIKDAEQLKRERKEEQQMQQQMMQSQMDEQQSKALANVGKGVQSMQNGGVDVAQLMGQNQVGGNSVGY